MTGIEAGADIATGALVARAVERHAGQGDGYGGVCLNCGAALLGPHCHECGQAGHVHRTIGAIGHEIAHGVFHFDGKIWRTLPLLTFHPGELTRRYVDGERARFVSPLAIFLFSVFLMFAIVANLPGWHFDDSGFLDPGVNGRMTQVRTKLGEERAKADQAIADANASLAEAKAKAEPDAERVQRIERRLVGLQKARGELATAEKVLPAPTTLDADDTPPSDDNWFEAKFRHARENPKLVLYKMKSSAYKFSWALIPLSLPFVWLLFPFSRRYGVYDHAVFTTYSLTFMSLLTIALAVFGALGVPAWMLWTAAAIIPPIHIYKQLKGAYRLGKLSAVLRTIVLSSFIMAIIVPIFAVLLVYLGVAD